MGKTEESQEFLERRSLQEFDEELVKLRHRYKMEELRVQRENSHLEHEERMSEIRLKNANIQRSIEEKDKRIRNFHSRREHSHQ